MSSLIKHLSKTEQKILLEDIYYLNTKEIYSFCNSHSIPYKILYEDGKLKTSRDKDRQKIVIERILHYLKTGKILPPTVFSKEIVRLEGLPANFDENSQLFYGCYEKKNPKMIALLKKLTNGEFKNGAVARILCRDFWAQGEAPTFKEFAKAWIKAREEYSLEQHPETAYLTDLSKRTTGTNWKKKRKEKAKKVIEFLDELKLP